MKEKTLHSVWYYATDNEHRRILKVLSTKNLTKAERTAIINAQPPTTPVRRR
jgi:hypothetical protein